jgi:hypothetical protein
MAARRRGIMANNCGAAAWQHRQAVGAEKHRKGGAGMGAKRKRMPWPKLARRGIKAATAAAWRRRGNVGQKPGVKAWRRLYRHRRETGLK